MSLVFTNFCRGFHKCYKDPSYLEFEGDGAYAIQILIDFCKRLKSNENDAFQSYYDLFQVKWLGRIQRHLYKSS